MENLTVSQYLTIDVFQTWIGLMDEVMNEIVLFLPQTV